MKQIPVGRGLFATVDEAGYRTVCRFTWSLRDGYPYAQTSRKRPAPKGVRCASGAFSMHAAIMKPPVGMVVDHINGDKLDNRRSNLRICTRSQNSKNHCKQDGDYKGVSHSMRGISAQITSKGVRYNLGYFATEEEAARAYDAKAIELWGEYAGLNFPTKRRFRIEKGAA